MTEIIFSFEETPESRQQSLSESSTYTLTYKAVGEIDDSVVQEYAWNYVPEYVDVINARLYLSEISTQPDGYAQYTVTCSYTKLDRTNQPVSSYTFNFDTSGGSANIKCAKQHIASYPTAGDWHKGAIGVKGDGEVEGVEIVLPALKFAVSYKHPSGVITPAYVKALAAITGTTNSVEFLGFAAGELLFAGASGSDGSEAEAECTYQFIASGNATGLTIGGIGGVAKKGHEYAWLEYKDEVESGSGVRQPLRVHVEKVYEAANWPEVFGWS